MSTFTNTFGGSAVSPADVAFASYSFGANLTLFWPAFANGQPNVAARFMNLTATTGSLNVTMPDATLVSVGYDVIIFNAGVSSFNVVSLNGNAIATIAPGQTYYLLLNTNNTQDGTWQTVQFGVGTGSASAAALAGSGLLAAAGTLNVNLNATTVASSYTVAPSARAVLQVWTGGTGTITLPTASSVGNGFFFALANNGSGAVTVTTSGSDQIDGASTSVFNQTQSGFIISSGTAWYTVGKGLQNTFAVTLLNLNVAGSSNVTETSAQAQNIIQQFTGTLTGNISVIVPNTVQLYYIYNNTSGNFTLTVKTAAGTGFAIPQGTHAILYCDGTNVLTAFTSTFSGAILISPGSANSPNFAFVGSPSTGIYSPSTNQIAATAGGFEVMNFVSVANSVNYLQSAAAATGNAASISALGGDSNVSLALITKGTGTVNIAAAAITGGTINGTTIGATTPAAITGTTINATSFVGPLTGNVTGNASTATALQTARNINGVSFNGTADITVTAAADTLTGTTLNSTVTGSSLTSVGTLTGGATGTGFTVALGASTVTGILTGANGGTGVANTGKTITLGGNLTTSGAFASTFTMTAATGVTFPTTGTLATLANSEALTNKSVNGVTLSTTQPSASYLAGGGAYITPAITQQIFTSSGTFTVPTNVTSNAVFKITCVGAGGGGGGSNGSIAAAGGGGGGGTAVGYYSATSLGTSQTITIGTGGTAGSATGGTGGVGGNSSVGALLTGTGGSGGVGSTAASGNSVAAPGNGSGATGGSVALSGASGGVGVSFSSAAASFSGYGGGSALGAGPNGLYTVAGAGVAGTTWGSGGSGAFGSSQAGGVGKGGIVIIEWVA